MYARAFPSTYRAHYLHFGTCTRMNLSYIYIYIYTPSQISSRESVCVPEYAYTLIPISFNLLNTNLQLPQSVYISDLVVVYIQRHIHTLSFPASAIPVYDINMYHLVSFHTRRCTYIFSHSRAVHVYFSFNTIN